jgi:hypothetical protein
LLVVGETCEHRLFGGDHLLTQVLDRALALRSSDDKPLTSILWVRSTLYESRVDQVVQ